MARIEITTSAEYVPTWGKYECVREFFQNWRDACVKAEVPGDFKYLPRTKTLRLESALLIGREAMLTGFTTKVNDPDMAGQHGEGFTLGCLAGVRNGLEITITSGNEVWRPSLEKSEQFAGQTTLVFNVRSLPKGRSGTEILLVGISPEEWEEMKSRFLFIDHTAAGKRIDTYYGEVLVDPAQKGKVYVAGIYVTQVSNLQYGYNLRPKTLKLDRDRRLVDAWELSNITGAMTRHALQKLAEHEKKDLGEFALDLLNDASAGVEAEGLSWAVSHDEKTAAAIRKAWEEKHGAKALPVTPSGDRENVLFSGATPVVVSGPAARAVLSALGGEKEAKQRILQATVTIVSREELDPREASVLARALKLLGAAGAPTESIEIEVGVFANPGTLGLANFALHKVTIARKTLASVGRATATLAHELLHVSLQAGDGTAAHTQACESLLEKVIDLLDSESK